MQKEQKTSIENFEPNVVGALSYALPFITGIVFFVLEKKSRFVRFHALQSILAWIVFYIINTLINSLRFLYIGYVLQPFVAIAGLGIWLFLIWKAYQGEEYHLPYLGKIAWDNSGFTKKDSEPEPPENPQSE